MYSLVLIFSISMMFLPYKCILCEMFDVLNDCLCYVVVCVCCQGDEGAPGEPGPPGPGGPPVRLLLNKSKKCFL